MICWTLGITEHHNAVDNVLALINLALLTGHVGRYGVGPEPAARPEQRAGRRRYGRHPEQAAGLPGRRGDDEARARYEKAWGVTIPPRYGWHLSQMFEAMERGELRTLYVIGENPANSEADQTHAIHLLESLDHLVVQDIFLTRTAEMADVVLPASASWCEAEGTVTNSERRVQRVRKALDPPGQARDDICRSSLTWPGGWDMTGDYDTAEDAWNELRSLSPMHAGMSYARLEALGGIQWPCFDENDPGAQFLHGRLWEQPGPGPAGAVQRGRARPAGGRAVTDEYPIRLTTGRRLDSYNTGVQSGGYTSPLRRGETLDLSPEDVDRLGLEEGERVLISSRRGSIEAPVRTDDSCARGWHS